MNDKDASAAIAALTIAYHELVVALSKTQAMNVSTLASTIDQRASQKRSRESLLDRLVHAREGVPRLSLARAVSLIATAAQESDDVTL